MKQLTSWFKNAVTAVLDPDRESRVSEIVNAIHQGMQKQGPQFNVASILSERQFSNSDVQEAKLRVYRGALERGWSDGILTSAEQNTAKWLAARLELPTETVKSLNIEHARRWFGLALAQAMEDGVLDAQEHNRLEVTAAAAGCALPDFARAFFHREGEAFLRSIFLACVADNGISQRHWNNLLHVAQTFGLRHQEMLTVIAPQARQFVERVLADATSDGRITSSEKTVLLWLLDNLNMPSDIRQYVLTEIQRVELLANIEDGRLPSVSPPAGFENRAGEIIHWVGLVVWRENKARKSGMQAIDHHGMLVLTDNRLVFSGGTKAQSVGYRKIISHQGAQGWVEIQPDGKPSSVYILQQPTPVFYAILRSAVAMANQTKLAKLDSSTTRHIPRDVRQRVWQKYGARCAECGATEYLEFDHIIPVARGGSNTDANVQLLCRMCNLKKSDHI
jgi:hypothetical protein